MTTEVKREPSPVRSIAALLSLPDEVATEYDIAKEVQKGFRTAAVTCLSKQFDRQLIIGPILSDSSFRRAQKNRKRLSADLSEELYEIARVLVATKRVFGSNDDNVKTFLMRPNPLLNGERPYDVARASSAGADAVISLLERAKAGIAV